MNPKEISMTGYMKLYTQLREKLPAGFTMKGIGFLPSGSWPMNRGTASLQWSMPMSFWPRRGMWSPGSGADTM